MLVHPLLFDQLFVLVSFVHSCSLVYTSYVFDWHVLKNITLPSGKLTWPRKSRLSKHELHSCSTVFIIVVRLSDRPDCIGLHCGKSLAPLSCRLGAAILLWRQAKRPPIEHYIQPYPANPSLSEIGEVIPKFPEISCTCQLLKRGTFCILLYVLFGADNHGPTGNLSSRRPCIISSCSNRAAWTFPVKISATMKSTCWGFRLARLEVEDVPSTGNFSLQKG